MEAVLTKRRMRDYEMICRYGVEGGAMSNELVKKSLEIVGARGKTRGNSKCSHKC